MANHSSSKKSIRKIARFTVINRTRRTRIRTSLKNVEAAITAGNKDQANELLRKAESEIMRGVNKGLYKKNTASRKISRLSNRIKALAA